MTVKFSPIGHLNVATDPTMLPSQAEGKNEVSGAMTRLKNMDIEEHGVAATRKGSRKLNASATDQTDPYLLVEQGGYRYLFSGTKIYQDEVSIATGLTSAQWRAFLYNPYNVTTQSIFALNGTDRKRIDGTNVNEWGLAAPTVAPTLAVGASTGLTGDYNAKYTYVRKSGSTVEAESNPSPAAAAAVTLANESLSVTCTAPSDTQVTHIRVYRTLTGGATYYYDSEITLPTVAVDTSVADGSLGSEVATDHDRPPLGTACFGPTFNGYCFIIKDNLLYFCKPNQPEYWPSTYYIEVSPPQHPLKAIRIHNGVVYCMSEHEIYMIQGTSYQNFFPFNMAAATGALSQEATWAVKGVGIYHISRDALWLFDGAADKKVTEDSFDPIFRSETRGTIPAISTIANSWLFLWKNFLWFGFPDTTYPDNILVINTQTNKARHYDYSQTFRAIAADLTNNRIIAADTSGYVWELNWGTDDAGTAVSWEIESKQYSDQLSKYFPRYAKYDLELGTGATGSGYILLDGAVKQTHSLTTSRKTKRRLIGGYTGDRLGIRLSGTGPVDFRQAEVE